MKHEFFYRCARALLLLALAAVAAFTLAGCDSGAQSLSARGPQVVLEIGTQGDSMVFDRRELTAPAGSVITVTFHNRSRLVAMDHNWILARPGSEESVVSAGVAAGAENDFVAPNDPNVIAKTSLTPRGESSSVTFPAPTPGAYPYLCAFPGHQMVMRGTLTITPWSGGESGTAPPNGDARDPGR